VVGSSFLLDLGVTGVGVVLHVTDRPRRRGPVVARVGEAYDDVRPGQALAFAAVRAMELALERGLRVVSVRGPFLKRDRGRLDGGAPRDVSGVSLVGRRLVELARFFVLARVQFTPRRRTLEARVLARVAARSPTPWRRPELFPEGRVEPRPRADSSLASPSCCLEEHDDFALECAPFDLDADEDIPF
jgi:hypothetical protein